jgi:hypothetical protein
MKENYTALETHKKHQLVAQSLYLLINAPTCFGLRCWTSSEGS